MCFSFLWVYSLHWQRKQLQHSADIGKFYISHCHMQRVELDSLIFLSTFIFPVWFWERWLVHHTVIKKKISLSATLAVPAGDQAYCWKNNFPDVCQTFPITKIIVYFIILCGGDETLVSLCKFGFQWCCYFEWQHLLDWVPKQQDTQYCNNVPCTFCGVRLL